MNLERKLDGKRALVTGSGTGIGQEIALELARQGADVALHYAHNDAGARLAVREIQDSGGKAQAFAADFNHVAEAQQLGQQALAFLGGIDILVNNAGITMNQPFEQVTCEQFDTLYHVNVRAPFFLTQTLLPEMLHQKRGIIINMTSIHAFQGFPEHAVYAGTKGAIVACTREWAMELAPRGIRVNAIAPGAVPVESHFQAIPGLDLATLGQCIPCGFAGTPSDIAQVAVFLASDDSRYIVGQTLVVDGGSTSRMSLNDDCQKTQSDMHFGKGYVPGL